MMDYMKAEEALGFKLHDWQKEFIEGTRGLWDLPPKSGKTTAYMLKLLTQYKSDLNMPDLEYISDGDYRDKEYVRWFAIELIKLRKKLADSGVEVRRIVK